MKFLRSFTLSALWVSLLMSGSLAAAPELPAGAKQLTTSDEIVQALTASRRKVTVYDMGKKVFTIHSTYDWPNKVINIDVGKKKKDSRKWDVKDDKFCVKNEPCRTIYLDGNKVFEVNPNGKVHATSEPL